ncbi:Cof-type HAD-IIB family hydrolase [Oceanobacillus sp. FSL H7-0719]|uniref:Cof-type HAD-IIB family hydrolase n=1 Tax=Oceanobacillus sp. FSL H7-0719 TaxID=2954507 RepID=UPI00325164B8
MKLIASDLDGTLLNEKGEVSEKNAEAIKRAVRQGMQFVVATGRSWEAASKPLIAAGISSPVICLNGAVIYDENHNKLHSITMDKAVCKQILSVCREADMYLEFFTNKGIYSVSQEYFLEVLVDIMKSANPKLTEEEIRDHAAMRFQMEPVAFIEDYDLIFEMEDVDIYKILGFSVDSAKLVSVREKLADAAGVTITSSGDINLEFNHPEAQKGIALERLAKRAGIEMKDVMAMGDNWNDASMLQAAGRGIAMGNASEEIQQLADDVTKSNIDDGVAAAIENVLFQIEK